MLNIHTYAHVILFRKIAATYAFYKLSGMKPFYSPSHYVRSKRLQCKGKHNSYSKVANYLTAM